MKCANFWICNMQRPLATKVFPRDEKTFSLNQRAALMRQRGFYLFLEHYINWTFWTFFPPTASTNLFAYNWRFPFQKKEKLFLIDDNWITWQIFFLWIMILMSFWEKNQRTSRGIFFWIWFNHECAKKFISQETNNCKKKAFKIF